LYHEVDLRYLNTMERAFPAGNSAFLALREDVDAMSKYLVFFQQELLRRHGIDVSDFFPTFAALAGAALPEGLTIDGHSFAPQLKAEKGRPREWVYVELNGIAYVRDARFKLTLGSDLFDLSRAPFEEILIDPKQATPEAKAARKRLQAVLDQHPTAKGALPAAQEHCRRHGH
jgi:arylsulfatase A